MVVDSRSSKPLAGATVVFVPADSAFRPWVTTTDARGRFLAAQLRPGAYRVEAKANGFAPMSIEAPAGATKPVVLRLLPLGAVTGRVVDARGRPVAGCCVYAIPLVARGETVSAKMNEHGAYWLTDLEEGPYWIAVHDEVPTYSPSLARPPIRAETFYPSVLNSSSAPFVRVKPGVVTPGIDIRTREVPGYRVTGTVPPGHPLVWLTPWFARTPNAGRSHTSQVRPDQQRFELPFVAPGEYWLEGSAGALAYLRVRDADLLDLRPNAPEPPILAGQIRNNGASIDLSKLSVQLWPVVRPVRDRSPAPEAASGADGTFALGPVAPGFYRLNLFGEDAADHYLESATAGGVDVLRDGLNPATLPAGPLAVTIADSGGRLEISLASPVPPVSNLSFALWPAPPHREELHRLALVEIRERRFSLRGIPPGDYFAAVLRGAEENEPRFGWLELLRAQEPRARRIRVTAASVQQLSLSPLTLP